MNQSLPNDAWQRYQDLLVRYSEGRLDFTLDISRMRFETEWLKSMEDRCVGAYAELAKLEAGAVANPDEGRMVGHYWLRCPEMAPSEEIRRGIEDGIRSAKEFAAQVHAGDIAPEKGGRFENLLLIGIGGSALGPQLVADALTDHTAPLQTYFLDNTDPDGMARVLSALGPQGLARTLCVVTSKSGGTPETRNGMIWAREAYRYAGLVFARHAVAITGTGSRLDRQAVEEGWLRRFPMEDWVGGRTSVMSVVGLVPACLQGVDVDAFLAGAAAMDEQTRRPETRRNAAMLLALMWYRAGHGRGAKDMVVIPYRDGLVLFSKYLQQLIMESLGKEFARGNQVRVEQGLAVYGNKGSTDQHAYVQQLRDGVNNFFAAFIEVRQNQCRDDVVVDEALAATSTDFLQGFLRGTRAALSEKGRESLTLSIPRVDAFNVGVLVALFERAVTFYASLVDINAYHQPGVEAGKKAAGDFLALLQRVRSELEKSQAPLTAGEVAAAIGAPPEDVFHTLNHLSETHASVRRTTAESPALDRFRWEE